MADTSQINLLDLNEDTIETVRKDIGLDEPGRMEEAVNLLEEWVKKQSHFVKKDFSRDYLERTLVTAKGSLEKSKQRLDKLCTLKTLMPDFFPEEFDIKKIIDQHSEIILNAHMPKLTKENHRIYIIKLTTENFDSKVISQYFRFSAMLCEYLRNTDYNSGHIIIDDFREAKNIVNLMTKINPVDLKRIMTLWTEGYGMRIKAIHLMSESKMVDKLLALFKQVVSDKIGNRIHVHKDVDTLHQFVPKDLLPVEYGGQEKPLLELHRQWVDLLSSEKNTEFYKMMFKAGTNESFRQADTFNDTYSGMPGSFRVLSVD